jgi:hypothetical protein
MFKDVFRHASNPVAAHLRFGTVRVEDSHPRICFPRWAYQNQAVRADAKMPVTDFSGDFGRTRYALVKAIHEHIVIPDSLHFRKFHLLSPTCGELCRTNADNYTLAGGFRKYDCGT